MKHDREKLSQLVQALPEINVILRDTLVGWDTSNGKRKYGKQVLIRAGEVFFMWFFVLKVIIGCLGLKIGFFKVSIIFLSDNKLKKIGF